MADIVQLAENGVLKYLKTHLKAVEGLDKELAKKQDVSQDTGWIKAAVAGDSTIYYRRVGDFVFVTGLGNASLPKSGLLWAIPASIKPFLAPATPLQYTLGNADSTATNITMIKIYADRMEVAYRNNDKNVTFDGVFWKTDVPFPNLITNK
ncbi:hypothetical protein CKN73_01555 [Carnobacterium divergens]|uniref:hypothetical protein n=1 Tax=Carnobacterium divergens TaxID=2748 RepID=UPI0010716E66|nr:hypothetical protein [Carnobacterium divergens]TFJ36729.1 hypothetical protein CKN77_13545 [Carnobacterium divergens]TFJ52226.1 hypothetical protein CKN73_01555 [Carnobacterium divergens]TFJ57392.1 hypothetical protein CKN83_01545 [Carnobacterium divergens]TFJ65818.1 hypothetical protein CKN89_01555 [Carnobacterium divergens]TFJ74123.1 hypothetical protein CKN91_01550 [Carnobacterium divergens]